MSLTAFDSQVLGPLFTDPDTAALFTDEAMIKAMVDVEGALAAAEGACGVIPQASAAMIEKTCARARIAAHRLSEGTLSDGVPVPALVKELRSQMDADHARFLHWGATSQDISDTGLILRLKSALDLHEARLRQLADTLAGLAAAHRDTPVAARTRTQQATPTSFGLKCAVWLSAVLRHIERLPGLRARLLLLSFGGAAGNLAALGDKAMEVEAALAARLGLGLAPAPWHTMRDGLDEYAGWLSLVTGTLGKMAQDVMLMAQNEVAELRPGSGGGSSTMPNKVNPVGAEVIVALARQNAGLLATMHQAALHEHERSGSNWSIEWLTLPQMVIATGAALAAATRMASELVVRGDVMRANIEASNGLMLAEAAMFALADHMPRPEAQELVKSACKAVNETGTHLFDVLAQRCDLPVDWEALKDPARHMGASGPMIDRVLESHQALGAKS
ncbi:3-carboxy-cis,cis-muconate cycloisomerase [Roseibium aestuarii]|uniref:3-carboxy-cis,cis-muconate cycloisomerase n=1 Tax=Roseibium aestuarii TaxID=2600299 RepID=A0ABW4JTH3_9HYPH|nr:3-carboxy-cis,cis-muconate cycloisomerase [Roseibium aestuarii]